MSDMADVLAHHRPQTGHPQYHDWCTCGWTGSVLFGGWFSAHQAAALSAAGFGPVQEEKREAWDEGYTIGNAHNGRRDANPYRAVAERGGA